jgi:chromosomal replication initiator protein
MSTLAATTWNDILGHFRVNHAELVRGWFSDLRPAEVDGGVVRIRAANEAQVRYLDRHCRLPLTEAAQAATGRLVTLAFDATDAEQGNGRVDARGEPLSELPINPEFTFENFVTGPCNRLAHAAALAVSEEPGRVYNPYFIHGAVGLGKTHLLQAICQSVRQRRPDSRCSYLSCETFTNHFIEAVECGSLNQFRYRYRHVDVLVIDDIQFLAERERSQEEFFHTFNTLHQSQRQIVLSADCAPGEIPSLEERLISRFNSGLVALMDRPCFETRMAIVGKKAKLRAIEVPEEVIREVASALDTNIRELEGALTRLDALSQTQGGKITLELAKAALRTPQRGPVAIPTILEAVAERFSLKVSDLQSKRRSKSVTFPRHLCMYLARRMTGQSLEAIGGYFGGRDHTTVLHASRLIGDRMEQEPELRETVERLAAEVRNGAGHLSAS